MAITRLFSFLSALAGPVPDAELDGRNARRIGPVGHFREFTLPRRYQRGGAPQPRRNPALRGLLRVIVPLTGEKIP